MPLLAKDKNGVTREGLGRNKSTPEHQPLTLAPLCTIGDKYQDYLNEIRDTFWA
jgi:hypothetical protein